MEKTLKFPNMNVNDQRFSTQLPSSVITFATV